MGVWEVQLGAEQQAGNCSSCWKHCGACWGAAECNRGLPALVLCQQHTASADPADISQ